MTLRMFCCIALTFFFSSLFTYAGNNKEKSESTITNEKFLQFNKQGKPRFDQRKIERQIQTKEKISRQREMMKRHQADQQRAEQRRSMKKAAAPPKMELVKLFGKETKFYRAPGEMRQQKNKQQFPHIQNSAVSNVRINGKTSDTIYTDGKAVLTFSFAPGHLTAKVNSYLDINKNGSIDDSDFPEIGFVMDNSDYDENSIEGEYQTTINNADQDGTIIASYIYEVDDFQSTSQASLVIQQHPSSLVFQGHTTPPAPLIACRITQGSTPFYVFTDTSGKFTSYLDTNKIQEAEIIVYDILEKIPGYLPQFPDPIEIVSDTTEVVINFVAAQSFIDGYIKDQYGAGINGVEIIGIKPNQQGLQVRTHTDTSGHFNIGVNIGEWYVFINRPDNPEYMRKTTNPIEVVVSSAGTKTLNHTILKANSTISGKVILNASGLEGFPVLAYGDTLDNYIFTEANGEYHLPVVSPVPGPYDIYADVLNGYMMIPVHIPAQPGATNVNFEVKKVLGGLKGTVKDSVTGELITDALLYFNGPDFNYAYTNDSGFYKVSLLDGTYSIDVYAEPFYDYSTDNIVISGSVATKNFQLKRSGSISGTVQDEQGKPLENSHVSVYGSDGYISGYGYPNAEGKFLVGGLTTGDYTAVANLNGYVSQWYNHKIVSDSANIIHVTEGIETPQINFVLSKGGSLSGKVQNSDGMPVEGVEIAVHDTLYNSHSYVVTDDSGNYKASGLVTGKYYVQASHYKYFEQWYNGAATEYEASTVNVLIDQNTPGINFTLLPGGTITGNVKNLNGQPISSALIFLVDTVFSNTAYSSTNSSGNYEINRVKPGVKYMVSASASGFARRWYNNARTVDSSTQIVLAEEEVRNNVNFTLPPAAVISGTVRDASAQPVPYANVITYTDLEVFYDYADVNGNYTSANLSGVEYYIYVDDFNYEPQWYDHKSSSINADPVLGIEGTTITGIDFDLDPVTGVAEEPALLPTEFDLKQNYPNPFNPNTTITFDLPKQSFVSLKVYNMLGQEVAVMLNEVLPAGRYQKRWNANAFGSGVYFYAIRAGSFSETKKMLLIK